MNSLRSALSSAKRIRARSRSPKSRGGQRSLFLALNSGLSSVPVIDSLLVPVPDVLTSSDCRNEVSVKYLYGNNMLVVQYAVYKRLRRSIGESALQELPDWAEQGTAWANDCFPAVAVL